MAVRGVEFDLRDLGCARSMEVPVADTRMIQEELAERAGMAGIQSGMFLSRGFQ